MSSNNDYLNNQNPSVPKKGSVYILCAAILYDDGKEHMHQVKNIDTGFVVCGRRHHNCFITSFILNGEDGIQSLIRNKDWKVKQGFVTSDDRFVDRKEGGVIAYEAGQTDKLTKCLFSEDLY